MTTDFDFLPATPCYLNGVYSPLREARISVLDRGFIFGDGVYEVVPVYGGRLFRFEQHMARLNRSLAELRIPNPHDSAGWQQIIERLVHDFAHQAGQSPAESDQIIYIQITRGVAVRDHVMPAQITPTVFVMTNALKPISAEMRINGEACGIKAASVRGRREERHFSRRRAWLSGRA